MNQIALFPKIAFVGIIILSAMQLSSQTTLTLQPDELSGKDAHVNSNFGTANYESNRGLYAAGWTWSGNYGTVRSFIEFDQSSIPSNATILSANLSLYNDAGNTLVLTDGDHSSLTASNSSYVSRVLEPWDESEINWNNQPTYTEVDQVVLEESTSPTQDYLGIDVSNIIQYLVSNPSENHGLVLRLQTEESFAALIFASSDNLNSELHPKLEITYSVPVGIDDINQNTSRVVAFPNPSNGGLTVDFRSDLVSPTLVIVNSYGAVVHIEAYDSTDTVNLDLELPAGIYYLKIESEGKLAEAKRIVLE